MSTLSQKHREEMHEYIPDDEIDRVFGAASELFRKWGEQAPVIDDFENPGGIDLMDKLIRETLVPLAKSGIDKSLSKLAIASIWVFDPDNHKKDWTSPENIAGAVLHKRLGDSDMYLNEMRDLKNRKETGKWTMQFRDSAGNVSMERERTFPFWPLEERLGLDSYEKAFGFYLGECKKRRLA